MIETGTATDVFDLLSKIRVFAQTTLGWTVNKTTSDELYLQKGTEYWNFKATNNVQTTTSTANNTSRSSTGSNYNFPGICCIGSRGFNTSLAWDNQPGECIIPADLGVFHQTDIKQYIFLSNNTGDYLHILARRDSTTWTILTLGMLEKFGTWTGGQYTGADNSSSTLSATTKLWDYSTVGSAFTHATLSTAFWYNTNFIVSSLRFMRTFIATNPGNDLGGYASLCSPSEWNGRAPMFPLTTFLDIDGTNSAFMYAGAVPDVRHMFDQFMANGTEFVVGSDTWIFVNNLAFKKIPNP